MRNATENHTSHLREEGDEGTKGRQKSGDIQFLMKNET
jgi:hypothetical protein